MLFMINPSNRERYATELDQIFRLRHEVLIEDLKWKGLSSVDGREADQFDDANALYIGMREAGGGEIVGCMRLNPTSCPTLTSTAFPHLVQFCDIPSSPRVFDVTRHLVSRRWQQSLRSNLCNLDLLTGLFEYGCAENLLGFTALMTTSFFSSLLQIGVELDALGFPSEVEGSDCLVIFAPASEKTLRNLYRSTRNAQPRLRSSALAARPSPDLAA